MTVVDAPRLRVPDPPAARRFRLRPSVWAVALVVVGALAFAVRLRLLTQSGGLLGSDGYDDGVYYAAADALVHGRLPYRDVLLLQPPGTVLALTPFAWLGSVTQDPVGVVAARLAFIAVGAGNAVLLARIAKRFGTTAGLLAGFGYAVFFPAAYSERSTLLEPLGTCALLVAVLLARRATGDPRVGMLLSGLAAGVSLGMRIWYVVPVALIAVFHRRSLPSFVIGTAVAAIAIYLPFFIAGPAELVRQVVLDQLGRPRVTSQTLSHRVLLILGGRDAHLHPPWSALLSVHKVGLVLGIGILVLGIAACTVRGARLFPVMAAVTSLVLLASPSFFLHYGALTAPWLVLTASIGAARLLARLRSRHLRLAIGAVLLVAVMGWNLRAVQVAHPSAPIPAATLRPAALRVPGCVTSDDPQTLAALDVLSRDLQRGCTVWPDVTGYTYDRDALRVHGKAVPRRQNGLWQADVTHYLRSGDAVVVHRAATKLSAATSRVVRSGPVLARSGTWTLHAVSR